MIKKYMASTILFVVMVVLAAILLMVASVTASIGAADAFSSTTNDTKIRSAHQFLTIAAALGWSSLLVLIVILIVGVVAGGFSTKEVSTALLTKTNPTKEDLMAAYKGEKDLEKGHMTQIILLIVMIIIAIIAFVVGILAVIACVQIAGVPNRDSKANNAYTMSIITSIAGVGGVGLLIVAIISYFAIRKVRAKQLKDTEAFVKSTEEKLGVNHQELETATKKP